MEQRQRRQARSQMRDFSWSGGGRVDVMVRRWWRAEVGERVQSGGGLVVMNLLGEGSLFLDCVNVEADVGSGGSMSEAEAPGGCDCDCAWGRDRELSVAWWL